MKNESLQIILKSPKNTTGISLNSREGHLLYQTISSLSTISKAAEMNLFTQYTNIPEISAKSPSEIAQTLKKLIADDLVEQIFYIDYPEDKPVIISCFIALPPSGLADIPDKIFNEVCSRSANNILQYLKNSYTFNKQLFLEDLEKNLNTDIDITSGNFQHSLFSIISNINNIQLPLPLKKEIVSETLKRIENYLLEEKGILHYSQDLYIPLKEESILEHYEAADSFVKERLTVHYNDIIGSLLDENILAEETYKCNPFSEPVTLFSRKRAEIIHNAIRSSGKGKYPGQIALSTVILMDKIAQEKYREKHNFEIETAYQEYKNRILNHSDNWNEIIHFIGSGTIEKVHPFAWEKLQNDPELMFTTWIVKDEEKMVFCRRDPATVKGLLVSMALHTPDDYWKILALRKLLDENISLAKKVLSESTSIKLYGSLLKIAYLKYFPWYYFLIIPFSFGRDYLFKKAKEKISAEQLSLSDKISVQKSQKEKKQKIEIEVRLKQQSEDHLKNVIVHTLEKLWFTSGSLVTIGKVIETVKIDRDELKKIIEKESFKLIKQPKKDFEESYLLFPLDKHRKERETRLKEILFNRIESIVPKTTDDKRLLASYKTVYQALMNK